MLTISTDDPIRIPASVAVCPICCAEVVIDIDEREQNDEGTWQVSETGFTLDCSTAPEVSDREWNAWFRAHWSMPYGQWLPLERVVYVWLVENYRFE